MSHELRRRLALSRNSHDRDAVRRGDATLMEAVWHDADTHVLVIHQSATLIADDAIVMLAAPGVTATERLYLGRTDQAQFVAVMTDAAFSADEALALAQQNNPSAEWLDLRLVGPSLSDRDSGLFTQALALVNWHRSHPFAPQSGQPSRSDVGGWVRIDESGAQVFPRTDSAIIVLVTDADDRLLLGNNALWEKDRFSLLAGYVEPGESLEDAVVREVYEECGLRVVDPVYIASQPWPFPASLMLGFRASLAPGENADNLIADGEEILTLRWFTREQIIAESEADTIKLPGPVSIARHLIEEWLGQPLSQEDTWLGKR
ncbi:MAG: NAD(+) diphosphatase [Actinobacteria bacterium]|uniref:NAD(+) diphosphatase n=1 Tax=freshwater metagenome TaxID=449393 RepID=A0A6J7F6B7_9ZZZZ|nr:NAD(+) diphosphatase [Actinomycetota bacterium]